MTKQQFKEKYKITTWYCLNVYYRMWCIKNNTNDGWSDQPSLRKLVTAFSNIYFYYSFPAKRLVVKPTMLTLYRQDIDDNLSRLILVDSLKEYYAAKEALTFLNKLQ